MTVTVNDGGTVITGVDIERYRLRVIHSGLQIAIKTRSPAPHLLSACRKLGFTGRRKEDALAFIHKRIEALGEYNT